MVIVTDGLGTALGGLGTVTYGNEWLLQKILQMQADAVQ